MMHQTESGVALAVWVVPGAKRSEVAGPHGDALKVRVASPAEAGRANEAMLRLLSDRTGASCELLSGLKQRRKTVLIRDLTPDQVAAALGMAAVEET